MLKSVVAGAALLAIGGSSLVYAQHYGGPDGPGRFGFGASRPSPEDASAFTDARIAALKAGLQLTPDQEKNWPPFEQSLRDLAKLRAERQQTGAPADQQAAPNPFDRLQRRADRLAKYGAALKRVADSGAPLYQSLNDAQKHRFTMLARILRPHPRMAGFWHWRDGEREGRGPDGPRGFFEHRGGGDHGGGRGMMGRDHDEDSGRL